MGAPWKADARVAGPLFVIASFAWTVFSFAAMGEPDADKEGEGGDPVDRQDGSADVSAAKAGAGVTHVLEKGETIWDLSRKYGKRVAEILTANNLTAADVKALKPGAEILVPGVEEVASGGPESTAATPEMPKRRAPKTTIAQRRALARAAKLGLGTRKAASRLMTGNIAKEWIAAAGGKPGRLPGTLRWPVTKGWFVRGFGSGKDGYHLAVDIAGETGWNVRAAAAGIVGYAGDELKGYGNTVMVVHQGGWVTMYAHNSINLVVAGQRVARGAVLAELGSTGISKGPHLHFELIYDKQNCDPAPLFRPGIRHRNGRLSTIDKAVWIRPNARPKEVSCACRRGYPRAPHAQAGDDEPRPIEEEASVEPSDPESNEPEPGDLAP